MKFKFVYYYIYHFWSCLGIKCFHVKIHSKFYILDIYLLYCAENPSFQFALDILNFEAIIWEQKCTETHYLLRFTRSCEGECQAYCFLYKTYQLKLHKMVFRWQVTGDRWEVTGDMQHVNDITSQVTGDRIFLYFF